MKCREPRNRLMRFPNKDKSGGVVMVRTTVGFGPRKPCIVAAAKKDIYETTRPTLLLENGILPSRTIFTGGGGVVSATPYGDLPHKTVTTWRLGSKPLVRSASNCPVAAVSGQKN